MRMRRRRIPRVATPGQISTLPGLVRFGSADVNLTSWRLSSLVDCDDDFSRKVLEAASEAISLSLQDGAVPFFMPPREVKEKADPTLMCLELSLGTDDMENPVWVFSLANAVQSLITGVSSDHSCSPDEKSSDLRRMRDGLNELVLSIDKALSTESAGVD